MTTFWSRLKNRVKNSVARALLLEPIGRDRTLIKHPGEKKYAHFDWYDAILYSLNHEPAVFVDVVEYTRGFTTYSGLAVGFYGFYDLTSDCCYDFWVVSERDGTLCISVTCSRGRYPELVAADLLDPLFTIPWEDLTDLIQFGSYYTRAISYVTYLQVLAKIDQYKDRAKGDLAITTSIVSRQE